MREENSSVKPIINNHSNLTSAYSIHNNPPQIRLNKFTNSKEMIESIFGASGSKTETKFPRIRNPSDDTFAHRFIQKQFQNHNE